ncbi:hypothetical protein FA15DRAFT_624719 [Coprinopsis marcescibilis]|uniref:Aminoglycoside phosphotransferase domain-containing protein n=1 Tax=Coprinopsis marcescibilis TaxID=230819 RepID=A0A5C3KKR2_COPMA|nr:hypothetical protein FA15DRAFT_624719 [Coprinopsis marcescibilis]
MVSQSLDHPLPPVSTRRPFHLAFLSAALRITPTAIRRWAYSQLISIGERRGWRIHPGIYRLPFGLVVKRSPFDVQRVEAAALHFLESDTRDVSHPLLIDAVSTDERVAVRDETRRTTYTIMTFISGDTACDVMDDSFTPNDWARLEMDLRKQLDALRLHTSQQSHEICNAAGGIVYDPARLSWVAEEQLRLATAKEFFSQLWPGLSIPRNRDTIRPVIQPLIDKPIPISFCHADLVPRNLIFPGGLDAWRAGRSRVCIIDWEYAGWMPEPWDAIKSILILGEEDDPWLPFVKRVFPGYDEYLEAEMLWRSKSGMMII